MKTKTSLRLSTRSANDKVVFTQSIVTAMTGNAGFPAPVPSLSVVAHAAADLETALNRNDMRDKAKTTLVNTKEAALNDMLTLLALYVDGVAKGDANLILSTGMPVRADRAASHLPAAPLNLSAINTTVEGEVQVKWDKISNARVYVVEISDDVAATQATPLNGLPTVSTTARSFITWTLVDIIAHTKYVLSGLTSGIKYAVRVYAVSAKGKGNRSVPVIVKVL
jgi:hypothetical protein